MSCGSSRSPTRQLLLALALLSLPGHAVLAADGVEPAAWRKTLERIAPSVVSIQKPSDGLITTVDTSMVAKDQLCDSKKKLDANTPVIIALSVSAHMGQLMCQRHDRRFTESSISTLLTSGDHKKPIPRQTRLAMRRTSFIFS